ncbi:MAG: hypothetical protein M3Q34_04365 [bacterium]|nr:hypothetical protein [bacterium]
MPENTPIPKRNLPEDINALETLKSIAEKENPKCAVGGCGGMCGTSFCSKTIQGKINIINRQNNLESPKEE